MNKIEILNFFKFIKFYPTNISCGLCISWLIKKTVNWQRKDASHDQKKI